jgi:hypothetical protein
MHDVILRRSGYRIPARCACCGAPPTTSVPAKRSRGLFLGIAAVQTTVTVEVPYCASCIRHVKAFHRASFRGLQMPSVILAAFATFFAIIPAGEVWGGTQLLFVPMVLGIPVAVVAAFVMWRRRGRAAAASAMQGRHASGGPAVELTWFDESSFTLSCADLQFAGLLADANREARQVSA